MKIAIAAVFVAALACAQDNLPPPAPAPRPPVPAPAAAPAGPAAPAAPSSGAAAPALKATPPEPPAEPAAAPAPPRPMTSHDAADALSADELKRVIDLLRENYIRPDALNDDALARAGMQGLLDRLGAGARIFAKRADLAGVQSPFRSERIAPEVAYVRLGTMNLENLAALDKALSDNSVKPPASLILDLRATPPSTDFEFAAEICRRFCPRGRILFSIKRPKANDEEILTSREDARWRGLLVVLVDGDTAGAGEVVAAVLRTHLRAYIVGQRTQGEAAQFDDLPLGQGKVLRVAIGEVTLPDNSPVFPGGLTPDLVVPVPQDQTDALLANGLANGAASLVKDPDRPRLNEHALVSGTNPELDAMKALQERKARGEDLRPPARDVTLQRALDYIAGVAVYEAGHAKRN